MVPNTQPEKNASSKVSRTWALLLFAALAFPNNGMQCAPVPGAPNGGLAQASSPFAADSTPDPSGPAVSPSPSQGGVQTDDDLLSRFGDYSSSGYQRDPNAVTDPNLLDRLGDLSHEGYQRNPSVPDSVGTEDVLTPDPNLLDRFGAYSSSGYDRVSCTVNFESQLAGLDEAAREERVDGLIEGIRQDRIRTMERNGGQTNSQTECFDRQIAWLNANQYQ